MRNPSAQPTAADESLPTGAARETQPPATGRAGSGVPWLDIILNGGIPRNRVCLVSGEPGTGKTTLGLQFLLEGARHGEQGLYITLAETKEELFGVARSHDFDLKGIEVFELLPEGADGDDYSPERDYTALHPGEVELGENLERIVDEVERLKPKRVVIDSLTEIRLLAREPVRFRRQIISLKNFLVRRGCTVYFIDTHGAEGNKDSQLATICHGVLRFERLSPEYGHERRRMEVAKMRGVQFHGGYHDYVIRKGGLVIWPRLVAAEHHVEYAMAPIASGVGELDTLMGGGPDRGTAMLAIGPAGVGKSTLCQQYCAAAAARGEYFAWFSFDERLETLFKRSNAMGLDLPGLQAAGKCSIEQVDPGTLSPGEFIQRVRRHVERFGARIVVIDSLNGYMNAMPGERFLMIQMHELLTYLSQMGVLSMIVVAQHGLLGGALEPPVDLSYLSDTVAYLRYFEHAGEVRRALSVIKKRGASHETTIRELRMEARGIRVGMPLREFRGVLTGEPTFDGEPNHLLANPTIGSVPAGATRDGKDGKGGRGDALRP